VTAGARALYWDFDGILKAHKRAELALGIPVPDEPPLPAG
jgi:hypothetical protein